ncbi:MAG: pyridoxamine 5'-phosphate oxidase family protein [Lachnospiraceae bacterium]|nr:pyridoxamine 5'-phosphate oxidase family protein [Lachnospiraceae bacterium]
MKEVFSEKVKSIMNERFGHDVLIGLATVDGDMPYVRTVDACYDNGAFYVITYGLSRKMKQIEKNPTVAISGEWFTAHGKGVNLGYFCKEENKEIAEKLRKAFAAWIDNGHNNFEDENTCILCIKLTDGILFANGTRYDIDFTAE